MQLKKEEICRFAVCLIMASGIWDFAINAMAAEEQEPLRCIAFYSSVNGISSTIFQVAQSLEEQLEGYEQEVSLSVYSLSSDLYSSVEYKIQTAITLDMDVMIVSDLLEKADEDVYQQLLEHDIFVLVADGTLSSYEYSACIGTDNREAGERAARLIAQDEQKHLAGILATSFRENNISASRQDRLDGFVQEAEKYGNLETAPERICSSDPLEAMQTVKDYLEEYPRMDTLYCLDSASGVTASKVLAELGRQQEVLVFCFDLTDQIQEEMKTGGIDLVFVQNTEEIGLNCAEFLRKMAALEDWENLCRKEILLPCQVIAADGTADIQTEAEEE